MRYLPAASDFNDNYVQYSIESIVSEAQCGYPAGRGVR